MNRRIIAIAATLLLALAPTASAQGTLVETLAAVMPVMQRVSDATTAFADDPYDTANLDEVDAAAGALVTVLDANTPDACYAVWWSDLRGAAVLVGEVHDAWQSADTDRIKAFLIAGTFLINASTEELKTASDAC